MWDATLLPHCGHLFNSGARQRCDALRVRSRILDVLRFETPMTGGYESMLLQKNNDRLRERFKALQSYNRRRFAFAAL